MMTTANATLPRGISARYFSSALEAVLGRAMTRPFRWEGALIYRRRTPKKFGLKFAALEAEVEPGLRLKGWLTSPASGGAEAANAHGTVVLLHGISSCKESLLPHARWLGSWGYRCLLFDSRGHGESGGRFCTYGFRERHDLTRCLDLAEARFGSLGPVAVFGMSLGGAIALQWLEIDERVRCGIVESAFASLADVAAAYQYRLTRIRSSALTALALAGATRLADFPAVTVSPENTAERLRQPVLVIHGEADRNIPLAHGERIFSRLRALGSRWLPVPGGTHYRLQRTGGAAYLTAMREFLDTNCQW